MHSECFAGTDGGRLSSQILLAVHLSVMYPRRVQIWWAKGQSSRFLERPCRVHRPGHPRFLRYYFKLLWIGAFLLTNSVGLSDMQSFISNPTKFLPQFLYFKMGLKGSIDGSNSFASA
jgi:hypothetical protein